MINGFINIQKEEEESLKSVWTHSLSLSLEKVFGLASCTHYIFSLHEKISMFWWMKDQQPWFSYYPNYWVFFFDMELGKFKKKIKLGCFHNGLP